VGELEVFEQFSDCRIDYPVVISFFFGVSPQLSVGIGVAVKFSVLLKHTMMIANMRDVLRNWAATCSLNACNQKHAVE